MMLKTGTWNLSELSEIPKNGKTVFSIFHCGGGSTMGYKLSGYSVLGGVEIDKKMMEIYRKNHNPIHSYLMSIVDFNKLDTKELPKELIDLDILDGSPPCLSFSMAGSREKAWGENKKFREGQEFQVLDDLFFHFIETARKLRPKVVVSENVKGLVMGKARGYVKQIFNLFDLAGYDTQLFVLNSAFMGVPQRRERTIFVSRRKDLELPKIKLEFNEKPISIKQAFVGAENKNYKKLSASTLDLWNKCKQGSTLATVHEKGHRFNWSREDINQPCRTFTATGSKMILHPTEPRPFSNGEKVRIQSFPDDYNFLDNDAGYVCGMSVPPYMMNRISDQIYKQLLSVQNG
jgi:DNA (cytosine-5)-methyltransferase 1